MAVRQDASTGELVDDGKPKESQEQSSDVVQCKVYSPFKVYFEGAAKSVSAESAKGPFDILPRHHNFITLLVPCQLVIRTENDEEQLFDIGGGIMHVKANDIIV